MSLASPLALAWLAIAVPIVILYVLKIRLRRVPISSIMLWNEIFDEKTPRSIWQRLRHLISLLLQLAFLIFLVLALTDPFWSWQARDARRIALVIDTSASMNAVDRAEFASTASSRPASGPAAAAATGGTFVSERPRLDEARRLARQVVDALRDRDTLAIIAAGSQPRVVCGLTGHHRTLTDALESIGPTDGPTRVAEAVELARRVLADEKNRSIVIVSDGGFASAGDLARGVVPRPRTRAAAPAIITASGPASAPSDGRTAGDRDALKVEFVRVGGWTANVGITRFQVRRSLGDPLGYEILADVTNQSDAPAECRLEIELEDEILDVFPLKLEPGQTWSQVIRKASGDGGRLVAKLAPPRGRDAASGERTAEYVDALASDNRAYAVLPKRRPQNVILVTAGNLFLRGVFEANPLVNLTVMRETPAAVGPEDIVIYHKRGPETVPAGNTIVIDPEASTDLFGVGDPLASPLVAKQDGESPLMAHVRLDNVIMPRARKLTPVGLSPKGERPAATAAASGAAVKSRVLAEAINGEPVYFVSEAPGRRVLVLSADIEQGDLPLRTAFPILITNALAWFADAKGELNEALSAGTVGEIELPAGLRAAAALELISPSGVARPVLRREDRVIVGPLEEVGFWTVRPSAGSAGAGAASAPANPPVTTRPGGVEPLVIACNLNDRSESNLRVSPDLPTSDSALRAAFGGQPLWFYLVALACLLSAVEWGLYQRRKVG